MKKILSAMAIVGMMAVLSVSAFAAERTPAENKSPSHEEISVTEIAEGFSAGDTREDVVSKNVQETVNNLGSEYLSGLGEGLSVTDTAMDIK